MTDQGQVEAARSAGFEIRNPQRFARNMARLVDEAGKAATVMQPHIIPGHFTLNGDLAPIFRTLIQLQQAWLRQPQKLFEAQFKLWHSYLDLWHSSMLRLIGLKDGAVTPIAIPDPQDVRFNHPAWSEEP